MFRVDLHLHTVYSNDSTIKPRLLVDQLHAHPQIKGVAITDHNTLDGYFQVFKLAKDYEDLVILPGIEISTERGDLIVLGVEEKPKSPATLDSAVDFAKTADGTIIIPHPYRSLGLGDLAIAVKAHAVEVLNPTATSEENMMAQKLAKICGLPGVAGTDAHDAKDMWTVFTEVEASPNRESILNAIRKGAVRAGAARSSRLAILEGGEVYS